MSDVRPPTGEEGEPLRVWVVLVEPRYAGNVGSAARICKNFGAQGLILVNPCPLTDEARWMATHAVDVLEAAQVLPFEEVVRRFYTVAFTARLARGESQHRRFPYLTLRELRRWLERVSAEVALVFGREDWGLSNEEVEKVDLLCTIPTRPELPSLNLAQSVAIALYELHELIGGQRRLPPIRRARPETLQMLYDLYAELLEAVHHPPVRRPHTHLIFRRVIGRADATEKEVLSIYGVLRAALELLKGRREERTS